MAGIFPENPTMQQAFFGYDSFAPAYNYSPQTSSSYAPVNVSTDSRSLAYDSTYAPVIQISSPNSSADSYVSKKQQATAQAQGNATGATLPTSQESKPTTGATGGGISNTTMIVVAVAAVAALILIK